MSIKFSDGCFYDFNRPQSLELAVRRSATMAGVHRFDFEDLINDPFTDLDDWTVDDGTWIIAANQLSGTGNGTAFWRYLIHDTAVPPSFVATFQYVSGDKIGFFAHKKDGARDALMVWWDDTHCGVALVAADGATTELSILPYGIAAPAQIEIAVSWRYDRIDKDLKWLLLSLFADGRCMISMAYEVTTDWTGDSIGFAAFDNGTFIVDDFRIGQFSRIAEYLSVDPGETPAQGLARAVQSTRISYMCRYDGTLRVWSPGNRDSTATITTASEFRLLTRSDRVSSPTHVRVIGAMHALDRFDDGEGELHMHQFKQVDNAYLLSDAEVNVEAGKILNDAKEAQRQYQLVLPGLPLIEAHDVVTYNGVEYRVMSTQQHMQGQESGGNSYTLMLEMRSYVAI